MTLSADCNYDLEFDVHLECSCGLNPGFNVSCLATLLLLQKQLLKCDFSHDFQRDLISYFNL